MLRGRFAIAVLLNAVLLLNSVVAWSDESNSRQQPIQQRVSPQILKEAMALPDYKGKAPDTPEQMLMDLQQLTDRLRKSGDAEGADLLERFIHEQHQLLRRTAYDSESTNGKLLLHLKAFAANPLDLQEGSIFNNSVTSNLTKVQGELEHLLASGKARLCSNPFLIEGKSPSPIHRFADGEFTVPVHNQKPVTIEIRDFHTTVEVTPTIVAKDRVRFKITTVAGDGQTGLTLQPTGLTKTTCATCELSSMEAIVQLSERPGNAGNIYLIIEATARR